ncbi:MAG: hypothetical protein K6A15_02885 [Treponema sp.]|nr:hypothetical protein [Treponema sp.]
MKTIKKISIALVALFTCYLTSCVSTQVEQSAFESQTGVEMVVPMRVFTWVKADGAKTFMEDYLSGKITFDYSEEYNFIVKVENIDGTLQTTWGKQFTDNGEDIRSLIISAFISSCYAMENNKDGIDTAFDVMNQIFSDRLYTALIGCLSLSLENGLEAYKNKTDWESFKAEHFSIEDNTFVVLK